MKRVFFGLLAVMTLFTACDNTDDPAPGPKTEGLSGDITTSTTLDASTTYNLTGTLSVKDGGELIIPAGTVIEANNGFTNYIIVEQGGKIQVNGTASAPVKMVGKDAGNQSGFWGGLIINGYAPISGATTGTTANVEVDGNLIYGGSDVADNSGSITYLILGNTGAKSSADVEHNGLTLCGVGNQTKIENIFVYAGADDAVEFFGGSVNVTNFLSVDSDDDMFDFTQGYTGTLTNAYGVWSASHQSTESDPRGVEADGNFDGKYPDHVGQSNFTIANLTIEHFNTGTEPNVDAMTDAIKIRRGATATITNALIKSTGTIGDLIDLTDSKGNATDATSIDITFEVANISGDVSKPSDGSVAATINISNDNTGCDRSLFAWTGYSFEDASVESTILTGDITSQVTLDASKTYNLNGTLSVKDGGELIIPAGTVIEAQEGFANYIMVEQGGKIQVNGTAEAPVKMIGKDAGETSGFWGGLIINGYAPISGATSGTTANVEVDANLVYGGSNVEDNSGSITYLILGNTGAKSSADVEHNGLTLCGVGNKTVIENIYVYAGADDAVEFFGGSVNVTNFVSVNSDDDMFDFTQGYTGTLTNCYGIWTADHQSTESDPRGVEADGNFDGKYPDHVDQSNFTINGMTIVHMNTGNAANVDVMTDAIKIRRGATATITNALIAGAGSCADLIDLTDSKGDATTATSINYTVKDITFANEVKQPEAGDATITKSDNNTGADTSVFAWTGYSFPSL
nr:hypothetical protein [uncultured Carboxylicivirga sp.]